MREEYQPYVEELYAVADLLVESQRRELVVFHNDIAGRLKDLVTEDIMHCFSKNYDINAEITDFDEDTKITITCNDNDAHKTRYILQTLNKQIGNYVA